MKSQKGGTALLERPGNQTKLNPKKLKTRNSPPPDSRRRPMPDAPSANAQDAPAPYQALCLVATTTPEKVHDLQFAADAKAIPIRFVALTDVVASFHAADEEKTQCHENASEKLHEIHPIINNFRGNPDARKILSDYCAAQGIAPDDGKILFATEDAIFRFKDKAVWRALRPKLLPFVGEELLNKADNFGKEAGPGSETGPIISAVTPRKFFALAREAAREAGYAEKQQIATVQEASLTYTPLSAKDGDAFRPLSAKKTLHLTPPKTSADPFHIDSISDWLTDETSINEYKSTNAYKSTNDTRIVSIPNSARGMLVSKLAADLGIPQGKKQGFVQTLTPRRTQTPKHYHPKNFKVGILDAMARPGGHLPLAKEVLGKVSSGFTAILPNSVYASDSMPPAAGSSPGSALLPSLSGMGEVMAESDALLFAPLPQMPKPGEARAEDENYRHALATAQFQLFSAQVARQLVPRDMKKPAIIMNVDGCWDPALKQYYDFINKGMSKAYIPIRPQYGEHADQTTGTRRMGDSVIHNWTSDFDILTGPEADVRKQAMLLLHEYSRAYEMQPERLSNLPKVSVHAPEKLEGSKNLYRVAVFLSASSDNAMLNDGAYQLGYQLAKENFAVTWGAGNRHSMGAVYEGTRQCKRDYPHKPCWIEGYSTPEIIAQETKHGRAPEGLDYFRMNADIYERTADMIARSHAIIIEGGGGAGTGIEKYAALMLMKTHPELMKDKHLIIENRHIHGAEEDRFWHGALCTLFGAENFNPDGTLREGAKLPPNVHIIESPGRHETRDDAMTVKPTMELLRRLRTEHFSQREQQPDAALRGVRNWQTTTETPSLSMAH